MKAHTTKRSRITLWGLTAAAAVLCAFAASPAAAGPKEEDEAWKTYASKEGRYAVDVPKDAEPMVEGRQVSIDVGEEGTYTVNYEDIENIPANLPAETLAKVYDVQRDALVKAYEKAKVVKEDKSVKSGDHPARDFDFTCDQETTDAFGDTLTVPLYVRVRMCLVGRRSYVLMAMSRAPDENAIGDEKEAQTARAAAAERFLKSFRPAK